MESLVTAANRGSVSTGYDIANSLKNEPDNGERFHTADNLTNYSSLKKFTVSGWFKRTEITVQSLIWFNVSTNVSVQLEFNSADKLSFLFQDNAGNGVESYALTEGVFRDTSAYYHVILAVDTTQGTAANRTKIYVNGVNQNLKQGNGSYDTFPAQNYDAPLQNRHYLLGYDGGNNGFRGYVAEYYFLDGITASPTDLGEFDEDSGIWKPIEYAGNYGTEGYYMNFSDSANMGKDHGPNAQGNGFADPYGIAAADQSTDTPTNNFCTLNPLWTANPSYVGIIRNGATTLRYSSGTKASAKTTFGVTSGKWYWEAMPYGTIGSQYLGIQTDVTFNSGTGLSQDYTMALNTTGRYYSHSGSLSESGAGQFTNLTTSNVIGVALDLDSSTKAIKYYKDGSVILSLNLISNMQDETIFPFIQNYENRSFNLNFGGYTINTISSAATDENGYGTFEYAPPSGYYALCTKNLAEYG